MKIEIKYSIESIFDSPNKKYPVKKFICSISSMYEWRTLLISYLKLDYHEEIFVHEIKELKDY